MGESILLNNVSLSDLRELIAAAVRESVEAAMQTLPQPTPAPSADDLLSRQETADRLHVTTVTLNDWEHRGILTPVRIGRRVLYRVGDVQHALKGRP